MRYLSFYSRVLADVWLIDAAKRELPFGQCWLSHHSLRSTGGLRFRSFRFCSAWLNRVRKRQVHPQLKVY
jgi:hypothetical protein